MVTIYDVAKRAGVSKTLVSRVLNNQSGVSPESRSRIKEAMKELHYKPNTLARSLVLQRTNVVGVILDSLTEQYFFDVIRGVEAVSYTHLDVYKRQVLSCLRNSGKEICPWPVSGWP